MMPLGRFIHRWTRAGITGGLLLSLAIMTPAARGQVFVAPKPETDSEAGNGAVAAAAPDTPDANPHPVRDADPNEPLIAVAQAAPPGALPAKPDDEFEILIIQALESKTDLDVDNVPILDAIKQLSQNTGIPITIKPGTLDLLPYGSKTILSARIQGRPLSVSLTALLRPLGLTFEAGKRAVTIKPTGGLQRIARRATWDQLALLEKLYTTPWSEEFAATLTFKFDAGDFDERRAELLQEARKKGNGPAAEILDLATANRYDTWFPQDDAIMVLDQRKQVERQLETRVSLRYVQTGLRDALMDLADRAGVLLLMDPGVLSNLPPQTAERFSLSIDNATVRQALEVVSGQTGLTYQIERDGIRLTLDKDATTTSAANAMSSMGSSTAAEAALKALKTNPIIGQITITSPNNKDFEFSFFIREDDLPPEVNAMRKDRIRKAAAEISRALALEAPQD